MADTTPNTSGGGGNNTVNTFRTIWSLITETNPEQLNQYSKALDASVQKMVGAGDGSKQLSQTLQVGTTYAHTWWEATTTALENTTKSLGENGGAFASFGNTVEVSLGAVSDVMAATVKTAYAGWEALGGLLSVETVRALAGVAGAYVVLGGAVGAVTAQTAKFISNSADLVRTSKELEIGFGVMGVKVEEFSDNYENMVSRLNSGRGAQTFSGLLKAFDATGAVITYWYDKFAIGASHVEEGFINMFGGGERFAKWMRGGLIDNFKELVDQQRQFGNGKLFSAVDVTNADSLATGLKEIELVSGKDKTAIEQMFRTLKVETNNGTAAFDALAAAAEFSATHGGAGFDELFGILSRGARGIDSSQEAFNALGVSTKNADGYAASFAVRMERVTDLLRRINPAAAAAAKALAATPEGQAANIESQLASMERLGTLTAEKRKELIDRLAALDQQDGRRNEETRARQISDTKAFAEYEGNVIIGNRIALLNKEAVLNGQSLANMRAIQAARRQAQEEITRSTPVAGGAQQLEFQKQHNMEVEFYKQNIDYLTQYYKQVGSIREANVSTLAAKESNSDTLRMANMTEVLKLHQRDLDLAQKRFDKEAATDVDHVKEVALLQQRLELNRADRDTLIANNDEYHKTIELNTALGATIKERFFGAVAGTKAASDVETAQYQAQMMRIHDLEDARRKMNLGTSDLETKAAQTQIDYISKISDNYKRMGSAATSVYATDLGQLRERLTYADRLGSMIKKGVDASKNSPAATDALQKAAGSPEALLYSLKIGKEVQDAIDGGKLTEAFKNLSVEIASGDEKRIQLAADQIKATEKANNMGDAEQTLVAGKIAEMYQGSLANVWGLNKGNAQLVSKGEPAIDLHKLQADIVTNLDAAHVAIGENAKLISLYSDEIDRFTKKQHDLLPTQEKLSEDLQKVITEFKTLTSDPKLFIGMKDGLDKALDDIVAYAQKQVTLTFGEPRRQQHADKSRSLDELPENQPINQRTGAGKQEILKTATDAWNAELKGTFAEAVSNPFKDMLLKIFSDEPPKRGSSQPQPGAARTPPPPAPAQPFTAAQMQLIGQLIGQYAGAASAKAILDEFKP